jgi:hypothetical protein
MKKILLLLIVAVLGLPSMAEELTTNNAQRYYAEFKNYFTDDICTELAVPYSAMTDEQLQTAMSAMPQVLIDIAIKVKNNAWEKREKEFRVMEAKPYSNSYNWREYMKVNQYSNLQNPTGIMANNEYLYIFVGSELPDSIWIELNQVSGNMAYPLMSKVLQSGLNVVKISESEPGDEKMMFIQYYVDTDSSATSKKLADYPVVPIHIEGGYVNGYFDKARHTDEDWRDMIANHFKHYSVQVLGERTLFHMELNNIKKACPNTITDAINWWDEMVTRQHELMGADKYYDRWNDLMMAKDGYEGMFMYATEGYTYYEYYTLPDILPWNTVYADPGQMWGPAHEIGHMNQGAINIVSCTEASNNLFSNVQVHRTGKSTTRGNGVAYCADEYLKKTPFPLRGDVIGKSRMYFQLYLYFHAAGKDKTFYPRLFEALRKDRLEEGERDRNWVAQTMAIDNQLKFAEKCCEIAQMDLSEFFEVWGFFEPMKDAWVGDYTNFNVNLTKEEADASRARMQKYEKKGGHLMFIEDRIKPSPREDGASGNRIDFNEEFAIGKMGKVGQWGDYMDESVKAEGYYYALKNNTVEISTEKNAKGALGFKLYDAETGELLSINNSYQLIIPAAGLGKALRVVAAQADGTDYEIPNIEDSEDEEMQKAALSALISSTMKYVIYTTTTGNEIGYYYADAVQELKTVRNNANTAVKKNDTSKHSYKEWLQLLKEAKEAVDANPNAFARIQEHDAYQFENIEKYYYLCNDDMGVKGVSSINNLADKNKALWIVESSGNENCYFIKDKNGSYINDIATNGAYCNGRRAEQAIEFEVIYNNDCSLSFLAKNNNLHLALNNESMAVGTEVKNGNATWLVTLVVKNATAIEVVKSDEVDEIYDLQGRKVETPKRGVYIKNGKKVLY